MGDMQGSETAVFERILCGVDGTASSLTAVQAASRLQVREGTLRFVAAANIAKASQAGMAATHAAGQLQEEAEAALKEARALVPSAAGKLVIGNPATVLLREAESDETTLVVVGSHGHRRATAMVLGTVALALLRDAPCSVLIAREVTDPETWPRAVVVGVDGSPGSAVALAVAREFAGRFGSGVRAIASTADHFDPELAAAFAPELEEDSAGAVTALVAASGTADLVLVGSRGLHGLKALGSVSERVAHQARSSVLVIRPAPPV
ncbi:MAG TPA: universal stress protein [Gaiellaceae bacterium]|nr:universal stress protein [Gaiellaceae bacterium]